ncbi:MAG: aminotransferase class I/II-fold pyridoxal phosphate-dependent enzyme [Vicinamibacterales bacterium]
MRLLDKLQPIADRIAAAGGGPIPFSTVIDEIASPTEVVIDGRRTLMCGSNNYFGLSFHPEVLSAATAAIERQGAGTTGSRAANGTYAAHHDLETSFAAVFGMRQAIVFTTGYQANLGVISGLCGPDDVVMVDIESHASIYDGARLSGAQVFAFRHNSATDLGRKLRRLPDCSRCLVVVEGLYSISGDVAPLVEIASACREAGASLMVDEAHSFGVYGERGLGCAEAQGVLGQVDVIVGTFSKALAGVGGFCVSNHEAIGLLHFAARPYVFTASGSPASIAGVKAALTILQRDGSLRSRLWDNVRRVRAGLTRAGFTIGAAESPIVSIEIGEVDRTIAVWRALLEAGVYVNLVLPPACRPDRCLLRTSYSAAHTTEQIDRALDLFERVGASMGITAVRTA